MILAEIKDDVYIRAAIDLALGIGHFATSRKPEFPAGIAYEVQQAINSGMMPAGDGVTIGDMSRGFLRYRLSHLESLAEQPAR